MKTRKHLLETTFLIITFLFTVNIFAQANQQPDKMLHADTVTIHYKNAALKNFVSEIISDTDFNYRKTLKESKSSQKYYTEGDVEITEANLLKQFKKAARKSDSPEAFTLYFKNLNLNFVATLDQYAIEQLYNTIRQTTFYGFLANWQKYY